MLWKVPKKFPILKNGQVHIWRTSLMRSKNEREIFFRLLNLEERERASRFVIKDVANDFITARGILRILLSRYLDRNPGEVILQQNRYGKPCLESSPLKFNLSHSGGLALFIFALNRPVGIDVESIREIENFREIAEKFFAKKETEDLFLLPANEQQQAFFNCWSRKEAFIKAKGLGVYHGLKNFSVEVSSNKKGRIKLILDHDLYLLSSQKQQYNPSSKHVVASSSPHVAVSSSPHVSSGDPVFKNSHDSWSLEAIDPGEKYSGAFSVNASEYFFSLYDF